MNDNKLVAQALLEISKRGTTIFLEVGKEDKELIEAAKKIGIELPSPDLMVMKTVYAEIDKVNLNGVVLPKNAVKKGLPTLIGKQCNWEHNGSGFVCGYTISANINENKIETINVLFKSLFIDQADELKEKVQSGEAAVSFEIWNKNPDTGESVVKELENGFKEISPIIFHGTGVLLTHKPACPTAKIFKLVANKLTEAAEKVMHRVFEQDLVYAQLAIDNNEKEENIVDELKVEKIEEATYECECLKCGKIISSEKHCKDIKCSECGGEMRRKDRPGTGKGEEQLPEETKTEVKVEETKTQEIPVVAETKSAETKVEETKEVVAEAKSEETLKVEAETKVEEPKVEEKAEEKKEVVAEEKKEVAQPLEVIEPKVIVKVTSEYREIRISTYVDGTPSGTEEVKGYSKRTTEYKDGTKDEVEEEVEIKNKYTFAELEEAVNKAKEELINLHKAELEAKTNEVKVSLEQKITEKDKEIAKMQEELDKKNQEITTLTTEKAAQTKKDEQPSLTVGEVTAPGEDVTLKREKKAVNDFIASKHKK